MANEAKEKTVLAPSVGPDERQSFPLSSDNRIATSDSEINDQIEKNRRKFGKNISKDSAHERSGISANSHYAGTVRKSISEQTARHRRSALLRHLSLFRCVQGRQVLLYGAACLLYQHRQKNFGIMKCIWGRCCIWR